jgi:Holliday junction resolvase
MPGPASIYPLPFDDALRHRYVTAAAEQRVAELVAELQAAFPTLALTVSKVRGRANRLGLQSRDNLRGVPSLRRYSDWNDDFCRSEFARLKANKLGVYAWCARQGYDYLGFMRRVRGVVGRDEWDRALDRLPKREWRAKGDAFEIRVWQHLRDLGFVARRSPGSRTVSDIYGQREGLIVYVQCKGVKPHVTGAEWAGLLEMAAQGGGVALVAHRHGRSIRWYRLDGPQTYSSRRPWTRVEITESGIWQVAA